MDASLRFKQALGRLVRRAGLPVNRRIHVLDVRLTDPLNRSRLAIFFNSLNLYRTVTMSGSQAAPVKKEVVALPSVEVSSAVILAILPAML